jgi:uncharacterized protein (DUF1778 family)
MNQIKSERLSLRLDAESKKKIEQAATVIQSSVNSFIVSTVLEKADKIIQQHEEMILSSRDRDIFLEAILNPPPANEALSKAFSQHSSEVESDV